jgi:hypothetical protein
MMIAYCPFCGTELTIEDVEFVTGNLIWSKCCGKGCRCKRIKTSEQGFILEPAELAGKYIFARPFLR